MPRVMLCSGLVANGRNLRTAGKKRRVISPGNSLGMRGTGITAHPRMPENHPALAVPVEPKQQIRKSEFVLRRTRYFLTYSVPLYRSLCWFP
jgi:hypothetical protein